MQREAGELQDGEHLEAPSYPQDRMVLSQLQHYTIARARSGFHTNELRQGAGLGTAKQFVTRMLRRGPMKLTPQTTSLIVRYPSLALVWLFGLGNTCHIYSSPPPVEENIATLHILVIPKQYIRSQFPYLSRPTIVLSLDTQL